jgi:phosphoribosyl-ATP pyrophosphohydrolase
MKLIELMKQENTKYQKLLIPKNGGLSQDWWQSLGVSQIASDRYVDNGIEVERYRGEDIPLLCEDFTQRGIPVAGLTGDDLYDEYRLRNPDTGLRLIDTIDWIAQSREALYARPTLCLIAPEGTKRESLEGAAAVVNAKYEYQSRAYLDGYGISSIAVRSGGLENMVPSLYDCAVEIVQSGRTLRYTDTRADAPNDEREYPLVVLRAFRQSDMSLITSWPNDVLGQQYQSIADRFREPTGSTTSKLLSDRNSLVKKLGEETAELVSAYARADRDNVMEESQQVLWLVQCMLATEQVPWKEFLGYVRRMK